MSFELRRCQVSWGAGSLGGQIHGDDVDNDAGSITSIAADDNDTNDRVMTQKAEQQYNNREGRQCWICIVVWESERRGTTFW
jgi:hypothetical protein